MKTLTAFIFVIVIWGCSVKSQSEHPQNLEGKIDQLFQHIDDDTPGYMVAVIKDSSYLFKKGYGLANLEYDIPITEKSVFNVASLSKQFTAACIALLILEGKVNLEDNIKEFLPDFPRFQHEIQIKHLIYMTSGINDYYYNPRTNGTNWSTVNFFSIDTAIQASYNSGELMYKPGTQWSYSNINYMLMTKVVEKVSGMSFAEFSKQKLFIPLGMRNTYVNDDIFQVIPNRVNGYNYRDEENTSELIELGYLNRKGEGFLQIHRNSPHYGGSGIFTSVDDLKKWNINFQTKAFGGEKFYNLMHKTMKFKHDKANDAFGLVFGNFNGKKMVWYEGGDWGWSSYMMRFPEENLTVICLSNLGTGNAQKHAHRVMDVIVEEGLAFEEN